MRTVLERVAQLERESAAQLQVFTDIGELRAENAQLRAAYLEQLDQNESFKNEFADLRRELERLRSPSQRPTDRPPPEYSFRARGKLPPRR